MFENRKGLLYIKKRSVPEMLTYGIFFFPFIMAFLIEFLNLPSFVKYFVDAMYLVGVFLVFLQRGNRIKKNLAPFAVFTVVFLIYTLLIYLFNFQSPFYYLWGVRNNFRFYAAFFLYATIFDEEDAGDGLKLLDVMFWINAVISFFQFFVMGLRQDYLGGIFGVEKGCNAYTIIFFSIVVSKALLNFMNGKEKAVRCFFKIGVSLVIAAMAELKFYFVLFVIILVFSAMFTRFSFRKVVLVAAAAGVLMLSGLLLPILFGESRALSLENIIEIMTSKNYATAKDLGRFTAIPVIRRDYLTTVFERLFGMGLGNCDTSSFDICNSEFYRSHSYLNYNWFSSAMLFLETGYIGLFAYLSFFVICFVQARKNMKQKTSDELFCQIAMIMSVMCFIMVFYNSSLRTENAYVAFFPLALPFVNRTKNNAAETESINKEVSAW